MFLICKCFVKIVTELNQVNKFVIFNNFFVTLKIKMAKNVNMHAKKNQNDEFYTQLADIENEVINIKINLKEGCFL